MMWRLFIKLLLIFVAFAQPPIVHGAPKHWRRPAVRGAFNVDLYAYNKPMVNLAGQLQSTAGQALPMGQLLEQLAQSSRSTVYTQKTHYRHLEAGQTDNYLPRSPAASSIEAEDEVEQDTAENETANATANQIIAMPERKQSTDYLGAAIRTTRIATTTTEPEIDAAAAVSPINKQLAAQQLNESLGETHAQVSLYSHEYHVETQGNKKIVLINTLGTAAKINSDQSRESDSAEVMAKQTQPMKLQLALPALEENSNESKHSQELEVQVESVTTQNTVELISVSSTTSQPKVALPAGVLSHVLATEPLTQVEPNQAGHDYSKTALSDVVHVGEKKLNEANSMTTSEMKSPVPVPAEANAYDKEKESAQTNVQAGKDRQQQQMEPDQRHKHVGSQTDNDGHVVPVLEFKPASVAPVGKPVRSKSKRKQTQIKTKKPNEIDTKPTMATTLVPSLSAEALNSTALLMVGITNVKMPLKASPEITPQDTRHPLQNGDRHKSKGKGKAKRKGSQRRPSSTSEQEIETTTNWWHILPYAEIRKFLNTIYDSIASDDDDERAQRM